MSKGRHEKIKTDYKNRAKYGDRRDVRERGKRH